MKKPLPPPKKVSIVDGIAAAIEIVIMGILILVSIIAIHQLFKL